ncbi:MAG: tRNA pseudouridine(55) synthase TruB [Alphaproteobacteria bacterium]|nr:tRNA pseudouridine(55) synthase TruB [Alphaproteobacteria bacterium]
MARRQRGQPVNGWIVIDKPAGLTSTQVVGRVRRALDARKVGHGGTLDPLATGLLPIALGEATKTVAYVMDGRKRYEFTLRWGRATTTDDAEGEVVQESDRRPGEAEIRAALPDFQGEIEQVPPTYSAIKVAGQRAYDLARAEKTFELQPRRVRIDRLALLGLDDTDHATFAVECGKGAYMRALARDIGAVLDSPAHVVALRRTAVGPFTESDAISLESLDALRHSAAASGHLLPVEAALDDIPALDLTETEANRLRSGQAVPLLARGHRERVRDLTNGAMICAMSAGRAVALARFEDGGVRPVRVLNL